MTLKKLLIKFLASSPIIFFLFGILLLFQEKWYYMEQEVVFGSYFHGISIMFLTIFLTFFFYSLLNVKLPKINKKSDLKVFLFTFFVIYFAVYVLLAEYLWGFLL